MEVESGGDDEVLFDFAIALSSPPPAAAAATSGAPLAAAVDETPSSGCAPAVPAALRPMMSICARLSHALALQLVGLSAREVLARIQAPDGRRAAKKALRRCVEPLRGVACDVQVCDGTLVLLARHVRVNT